MIQYQKKFKTNDSSAQFKEISKPRINRTFLNQSVNITSPRDRFLLRNEDTILSARDNDEFDLDSAKKTVAIGDTESRYRKNTDVVSLDQSQTKISARQEDFNSKTLETNDVIERRIMIHEPSNTFTNEFPKPSNTKVKLKETSNSKHSFEVLQL